MNEANLEELDEQINCMMEKINGVWTCKMCGHTGSVNQKGDVKKHIEGKHIE